MHMFKPSLKRGIPEGKTFDNRHKFSIANPAPLPKKGEQKYQPRYPAPVIVPPSLFTNRTHVEHPPIFNPLNYQWNSYSPAIREMVNLDVEADNAARDVGVYDDILWCFNGDEVAMWKESTNFEKKYQLPYPSQIVAFGELQCSNVHFQSKNPIIMVVGMQNYIQLFGINRDTLACDDKKFCHQIPNSSYIQKITFAKKNEIIIVSNTGQHLVFDFTADFQIYRPYGGFILNRLPYLPLLYPKKNLFYESLVVSCDYVCSLVREEKKCNWFSYKAKQIVNSLTGDNTNLQWIMEHRKVEIYKINREKKLVELAYILNEEHILNKLRRSRQVDSYELKIVSINLRQGQENILQIAIRNGTFVCIDLDNHASFYKDSLTIPSDNNIGKIGFYVEKKPADLTEHVSLKVLDSLGTDNMSLTEDAVVYFGQKNIEIIRLGDYAGKLVEVKTETLQNKKWLFMTQSGYFTISRLTPREAIVAFIYQRDQKDSSKIIDLNKIYEKQNNFQCFIDAISHSIGPERVAESIIAGAMLDISTVEVSQEILAMAQKDLEGQQQVNIRDWDHVISQNKPTKRVKNSITMVIDLSISNKQQLWDILIGVGNKVSKCQPTNFESKSRRAGAYWMALKNIFSTITNLLALIEPKDIKTNLKNMNKAKDLLSKLCNFFEEKKKREVYISNYLYIMRKEDKSEKQDLYAYFRNKINKQTKKKLQDSMDTQITEREDRKYQHVSQSTLSLEKDITQAFTKIQSMINLFFCLAEVSDSEPMPTFLEVFRSRAAQRKVKAKLIEHLKTRQKLLQFDKALPELQLHKDISVLHWLKIHKKFKALQFNLEQISTWLSSTYLDKVLEVFKEKPHHQVELLLYCWSNITHQIKIAAQLQELCNNRIIAEKQSMDLYSEDSKALLLEHMQYLKSELKIIREKMEEIVEACIKEYVNCTEESYKDAENRLNIIIKFIIDKNDEELNEFVEGKLRKTKINEKIIFFRKHKKKTIKDVTVQERLMTKKPYLLKLQNSRDRYRTSYSLPLLK